MRGRVVFEEDNEDGISIQYPSFELRGIVEYYLEIIAPENSEHPFSIIALPNINIITSVYLTHHSQTFKLHHKHGISDVSGDKIGGSLTEAITIVHAPGTHEFSIKFKPGVLYSYLTTDIQNLINNHLPLREYVNPDIIDALKSKTSFQQRVQYAENILLNHLGSFSADFKLSTVSKAIYYANSNVDYKLNSIIKHVNVSEATLNRYFKEVIGISPKNCFKALRFKGGLRNYRSKICGSSYDELGYSDFSHFVREAKGLTNKTPSNL